MRPPPPLDDLARYRRRRGDTAFWKPWLQLIASRHGLRGAPRAGGNPTYPTFVLDDAVIKLYGGVPGWPAAAASERAVYACLARDPSLRVPRPLASGQLGEAPASWPYLVLTRVPGTACSQPPPGPAARARLLSAVGAELARVHALPCAALSAPAAWLAADPTEGAAASSLPPHLVAQVAGYLARHPPAPDDRVLAHLDLTATHVFREGDALTGLIDWGDAIPGDRHLELIQVFRDLAGCQQEAFAAFLDGYGWPRQDDFPHRALAAGLRRQAIGRAQHLSIDCFEPIAARYPLERIPTLEALAETLFGRC